MEVTYPETHVTEFRHDGMTGIAFAREYPHSSHITHIYGSYISFGNRGQGLGSKYHKERLDFFKEQIEVGCLSAVTCIVNKNNEPQMKILKKNGWKFIYEMKDTWLCVWDNHKEVPYSATQQPSDEDDL